MADDEDDLDAFFDEVEEVVEKAVQEETTPPTTGEDTVEPQQPPAKKPKIAPRGIVVAAASAASNVHKPLVDSSSIAPSQADHLPPAPPSTTTLNVPPPPPPPPPLPPGSQKAHVRHAAGKTWEDHKLADWPDNDFRLFVGNLGQEISDEMLLEHFHAYASAQRAAVIREPSGKAKGYGFVSFADPLQFAKALREMEQSWLGARPIRVKRSNWKDREVNHSNSNKQKKKW